VDYFVINDTINSRTALGLRTTEPPATPATERIVQRIEVDGREGALTILKGWKDCEISFQTALLGADIRAKYRTALGLHIAQPPQIPPAKRIVTSIEVDGREGSLTILKGWEDTAIDMTVAIIGKAVVLNLLSAHLILDSELKTCYFGNTAQNNLMTGNFPVFEVGSNTITLGTGITKVEIEPRWRFL
jgi:phage-related protein